MLLTGFLLGLFCIPLLKEHVTSNYEKRERGKSEEEKK
jgi:hypothetical protein